MQGTFFDTAIGEVSIEAKRPWLLQRNPEEFNHADITEKTGWKIRIRKATTIQSSTIKAINYNLKISAQKGQDSSSRLARKSLGQNSRKNPKFHY